MSIPAVRVVLKAVAIRNMCYKLPSEIVNNSGLTVQANAPQGCIISCWASTLC